ncbi:MAG: hypothetical protein NVS4B9_42070 [Ktedonobacteraceae bacterium]
MRPRFPSKTAWSLRRWALLGAMLLTLLGLVGYGAATALAHPAVGAQTATRAEDDYPPVVVTVFSPGQGDRAGLAGAGFVIDLSLDAARPADNAYLSAAKGYKPFFNDPNSTTFHPGSDPGAPGLVVLLSTTMTIPGTPFVGPGTNLAGLFQINGVAMVNQGTLAETWNTWQVGKAIAGVGVQSTLTVFVVKGTAPAAISGEPEDQPGRISNIVHVTFTIAG